jgi:hypothetical protein
MGLAEVSIVLVKFGDMSNVRIDMAKGMPRQLLRAHWFLNLDL